MRLMRYTGPEPAVNTDVSAEVGPEAARLETDKTYEVSDALADRLEASSQHWEPAGGKRAERLEQAKTPSKKELLAEAHELGLAHLNSRTLKATVEAEIAAAKATAGAGDPDQPGDYPDGVAPPADELEED